MSGCVQAWNPTVFYFESLALWHIENILWLLKSDGARIAFFKKSIQGK
jgi:hypothetical protein